MPTKRELLEEKTVKELRQMAREKDLTGYSAMRKDELIDLVEDNYLKDEITSWPEEAGEEEAGVPVTLKEKLKSNLLIVGISVCAAAVLIGFALGHMGIGSGGPTAGHRFVSENYGFSFNYPSGWVVEKGMENSYLVSENVPENQKKGSVQISIRNLIQGGPRNINGVEGIELTSRTSTMGGALRRINQIILPRDNKIYSAGAVSLENEYEDYKSDFNMILDSFTFSKSDLGSAKNENKENYANDNYGIYFNYPSGWILQSSSQGDTFSVFVRDNVFGGTMGAQAFVQVLDVDKASSRDVEGFRGVEITNTRSSTNPLGGTSTTKSRSLLVVKENRAYSVSASAPENVYGGYKSQFDEIIESFTFLK